MVSLSQSESYTKAAIRLPKDAKVKLFKIYYLLLSDPRHPSLQFKKVKGAKRNDIYECRVDRFWRIIIQWAGGDNYQLVTVGEHDKAIQYGTRIAESQFQYYMTYPRSQTTENIDKYLDGNDEAMSFREYSKEDIQMDEFLLNSSEYE